MKRGKNSASDRRNDDITLMDTDELARNVLARGMLNFIHYNGS